MTPPGPMYNQIVLSCWTRSSVEQGNSYIGIIHHGSSKKKPSRIYTVTNKSCPTRTRFFAKKILGHVQQAPTIGID